jgi:glycosyltransferase involved in cell wall biosynthesis
MDKILHISKFYSPYEGGIESTCKYIISYLPNYEHKVICFSGSRTTKTDFVDGIPILRVGCIGKIARQDISFTYFFELRKLLKEYKPDLIHFHAPNPLVMLFASLLMPKRCKLVIHWHSDIIAQKYFYPIVRPLENFFLKRANVIFVTSPNYLEASKPLKHVKSKVKIIPSAIQPELFRKTDDVEERCNEIRQKANHKKIVFFMGRHVTYKGLKFLLEAEKMLKSDCRILIAGTGPLTNALKTQYHSNRVEFLGRISNSDVCPYLYAADVFAFPSITKNEAFGLVLAEAMYCETPPITFTIEGSGVNWVNLDKVTGLEVENGNITLLAEAIDNLLSDDLLRTTLGKQAKERVLENFTMDQIGLKINDEYQVLLKS